MGINILLMHWWPFLHLISEGNTTAGAAVPTLTPVNRLLPGNCCIRLWGGFLFKFQRNEVPWKHNVPVSAVIFKLKQTGTLWANKLYTLTKWSLPVLLTRCVPTDLKTMLGMRTNPAIRRKETKLSTTKNLRNRKKDWTPPPKLPVGTTHVHDLWAGEAEKNKKKQNL